MSPRKVIVAVLAVLLVAAGALVYVMTSSDESEDGGNGNGSGAPERVAPEDATAPAIYYVEGSELKRTEPDDAGEGETIAEGISAAADADPSSQHVAWVAFAGPERPVTHVYTFGEDGVRTVSGTSPVWKADGSAFAILRPVGGATCDDRECNGPVEVHTVDADDLEGTEVLNRGRWSLHGWTGDNLIVGDAESPDESFIVTGKNEVTPIDVPSDTIRSVSPDGRWFTVAKETGPELWSLEGDEVEFVERFGGPEDTFTAVDWSEDSSRFAAVLVTLEDATIVVADVDSSTPETVMDHLQPSGDVFWAPDEAGIVFTAVNREDTQLEATWCPLGEEDCTTYVTWQTGTSVIGPTP